MKHRLVSILALLSCASAATAADAKRPNILWLIAEDMSPDAMSCYGAPQASTPNLDKLATGGVRYTRETKKQRNTSTQLTDIKTETRAINGKLDMLSREITDVLVLVKINVSGVK